MTTEITNVTYSACVPIRALIDYRLVPSLDERLVKQMMDELRKKRDAEILAVIESEKWSKRRRQLFPPRASEAEAIAAGMRLSRF